ncbi:hypothetical protein D915_010899 [Fasciola hepatica]|uniref:Uncharacterized protein n=1 Tax=Fasciola hepatica TaxID=6192 RepID=A0A4E0QYZ7_FASHE|nr:hypothetical protein D915_010899 [Fasciola hepatica]
MSRTCARQQRMRQQILNEERMSHADEASVRPSGERRSSGSKLIISSPTPTAHPFMNHTNPVSQSTLLSDPNSTRNLNQPVQSAGASALLAFLSGSDHRPPTQMSNANASQPPRQTSAPQQQQQGQEQQQQQQPSSHAAQNKTSSSQLPPSILVSPRPGKLNGIAVRVDTTTISVLSGSASSENSALYSANTNSSANGDNGEVVDSSAPSRDSSGMLSNQICSVSDESGPSSTRSSDPGPHRSNKLLPVDIRTMDLESTVSPVSSDLNSVSLRHFHLVAPYRISQSSVWLNLINLNLSLPMYHKAKYMLNSTTLSESNCSVKKKYSNCAVLQHLCYFKNCRDC